MKKRPGSISDFSSNFRASRKPVSSSFCTCSNRGLKRAKSSQRSRLAISSAAFFLRSRSNMLQFCDRWRFNLDPERAEQRVVIHLFRITGLREVGAIQHSLMIHRLNQVAAFL